MEQTAQDIARDYQVNIRWSADDGFYIAHVAEMPLVMADGLTREDAAREIGEALVAVIEAAQAHGHPLPESRRAAVV